MAADRANTLKRRSKAPYDVCRRQPKHSVAGPVKLAVPARIGALAQSMVSTVDLDDEPQLRRVEVDDVPVEQDDLAPKRDA
jgi:hypothetical protein